MRFSQLSVMVVEDHGFQRRMALRLLADLGVESCLEAADAATALDQLRDRQPLIDVVVVDLDLPGMDGVDFIRHLADDKLARAIIVVSALEAALQHTVQSMARACGLRVLACVDKPITGTKLSDALSLFDREDDPAELPAPEGITLDALREGLARDEFQPWFQPQVTFSNGQPMAVEALARWQRADGQVVRPAHFIPMFEREGLIEQLTDLVLERSCVWQQRWLQSGRRLRIAVNVSMPLLSQPGTADRFERIVRGHGLEPRDVVLELTESAVMEEAASALGALARLRLKGFGLSIDDFGTGYSSLTQLSQIPFTELKIDRSFVSGAPDNPRRRAVVEASLELARKLGLTVVGEGVETVEEWQMLAELGCTLAQGYLIARPVPGEQLLDAIAAWRRPEA